MGDSNLFTDYRMRVISFGLIVSWAALGVFAVVAALDEGLTDRSVLYPLIAMAAALPILTVLPWRRVLGGVVADVYILVWCALLIFGILVVEGFRTSEAVVAAFLGIVVFASATLVAPGIVALVGMSATIGYIVALISGEATFETVDLVVRIAAFALTAFLMLVAARGIRRQMTATSDRLTDLGGREGELARRENELERLYDISRTIGYGSSLGEVLPELVGRVAAAVGAKTGLVLLYRPDQELLEVMSPIWVSGHTVRVEGYAIQLTTTGIAQRVFTSCAPAVSDVDDEGQSDAFLLELDATHIAAVPLQIESRPIGVLIAADKAEGKFSEDDIALLESLAGPSALVLNQMARFQEAQETGKKMAELAQLKTEFVSVVSHELRTPLTSIIGSLKTLQRSELSPTHPNAVELLTTAERQAQRLRALIEDLLVVSRLDNQALPVRPEIVDVEEFLWEVIRDIPGARPVVTIEILEGAEKLRVDPGHLRRIVRNLLENALKYAPGSEVDLIAKRRGTEIWISIADHGPGIPYELHEHIFDRFTQVHRHETRGIGGTGLGLSIVRGLTEAMGGRVWFEPTQDSGATFNVAMPVRAGTRTARADL